MCAGEKEGCLCVSTGDGGDQIWSSREKRSAGSLPGFLFLSYVFSLIIPNISYFRVFSSQLFVASVWENISIMCLTILLCY